MRRHPLSTTRLYKSFGYALKGIAELLMSQANARIHLLAIIVVSIAGFYYRINAEEWRSVVFAFAIVLAAEGFNTAIEYLTDLVSPEHHPLAGKTKDVAAGAVLICAIGAVLIGGIIFLPKIFAHI